MTRLGAQELYLDPLVGVEGIKFTSECHIYRKVRRRGFAKCIENRRTLKDLQTGMLNRMRAKMKARTGGEKGRHLRP